MRRRRYDKQHLEHSAPQQGRAGRLVRSSYDSAPRRDDRLISEPALCREREPEGWPESRPALPDHFLVNTVTDHVERHIGPVEGTVRPSEPHCVDVTVLHVGPSSERPWHTFVTAGMAQEPMRVPKGGEASPHAELVLSLPGSWPSERIGRQPRRRWPIVELLAAALLPHQTRSFLAWGHTVAAPIAEPYAPGTRLAACFLRRPVLVPGDFHRLRVGEDREVEFLALVPITADELEVKLSCCTGAILLDQLLGKAGVTELCDPSRPDVTEVLPPCSARA